MTAKRMKYDYVNFLVLLKNAKIWINHLIHLEVKYSKYLLIIFAIVTGNKSDKSKASLKFK